MELIEIKEVKNLDHNSNMKGNIDLSFLKNYKTPKRSKELATSETLGKSIIPPNIDIEIRRLRAKIEIRSINSQIQQINQIGDDFEKAQYIGSTIHAIKAENLPKLLAQIDNQLGNNQAFYNEEDIQIKELIEKRRY